MASAIKTVTYYTANPVECCDRCSQGIKHVALVTYKDGYVQKYGMDCIEKILAAAPDLAKLFKSNAKRVRKYRDYLAILTGPVESMPRGREYFNSGLYFIADSEGKDISFGTHWLFHPIFDAEKNAAGRDYRVKDAAANRAKCLAVIAADVPAITKEVERLESFLGRILATGFAAPGASV